MAGTLCLKEKAGQGSAAQMPTWSGLFRGLALYWAASWNHRDARELNMNETS